MKLRWLHVVFPLLLWACTRNGLSEKERQSIVDEVGRTLKNYQNDVRSSGLLAELSYLDTAKEFFWVPPGFFGPISRDSVKAILENSAPQFKTIDNDYESLQIVPLSMDVATYTAKLRSNMTEVSGKKYSFVLLETGVVVRRKDGWKLHSGQTNALDKP